MRLLALAICLMSLKALAIPQPAPEAKAKAVVQEIKAVEDIRRFVYPARVEAKINSTVTADLDGHVLRIVKTLGSTVRTGEIVLYIENRDPAFTYSAVPVRAPITGTISSLSPQLMSKVAKGEKLFTVMNPEILHINAEIPATDIAFLRPGTTGKFKTSTAVEPFDIRIIGLSPIVDPRTGTATAEIEFNAPKQASAHVKKSLEKPIIMKPVNIVPPVGSVGQVLFQISSGEVMLLPENSLSYVEGKPTVKVIDAQNKASRREIELGEQREDQYVIKSGLKPGEKIVVRANKNIKDGDEVEPQGAAQGKGTN